MKRSDIILNIVRMSEGLMTEDEKLDFVNALRNKIERIYSVISILEKDDMFSNLSDLLRKSLEDN